MEELSQKLNQYFPGKAVRKDLTKKIKEGANVPVYVLECSMESFEDGLLIGNVENVSIDEEYLTKGMEDRNVRDIIEILGKDSENKVSKLNSKKDIDDPWYTGNFEMTYNEDMIQNNRMKL